jgi:hypothetical protein
VDDPSRISGEAAKGARTRRCGRPAADLAATADAGVDGDHLDGSRADRRWRCNGLLTIRFGLQSRASRLNRPRRAAELSPDGDLASQDDRKDNGR